MNILLLFLLMPYGNVFGNKNGHEKEVDALLRSGQTFIQQMQKNLRNDVNMEDLNETLKPLKSLVEKECELANLDDKEASWSCDAKKSENLGIQKLDEFLTNSNQIIEQMTKTEKSTVKGSTEGVYGTLTEILSKAKMFPKCVKLRTYVKVIRTIRLINEKMEQGPAKDAIEKVIHKNTVAKGKNTVPIMPSELLGLAKEIWTDFLQNIGEMDQNSTDCEHFQKSFGQLTHFAQILAIVWIALRAIEMKSNLLSLEPVLFMTISSLSMIELKYNQNAMKMAKNERTKAEEQSDSMPTSDDSMPHFEQVQAYIMPTGRVAETIQKLSEEETKEGKNV